MSDTPGMRADVGTGRHGEKAVRSEENESVKKLQQVPGTGAPGRGRSKSRAARAMEQAVNQEIGRERKEEKKDKKAAKREKEELEKLDEEPLQPEE